MSKSPNKHEQFEKSIDKIFNKCKDTLIKKGTDYESIEDPHNNFIRHAERLGISKYQVWAVYFGKHSDAIYNVIKKHPHKPKASGDHLREKIMDMINYLFFLNSMLEVDDLGDEIE